MVLPKFEKWHGNNLINEVVLGGRSFFFFVFMWEQNSSTVLGLFKKKSFFFVCFIKKHFVPSSQNEGNIKVFFFCLFFYNCPKVNKSSVKKKKEHLFLAWEVASQNVPFTVKQDINKKTGFWSWNKKSEQKKLWETIFSLNSGENKFDGIWKIISV